MFDKMLVLLLWHLVPLASAQSLQHLNNSHGGAYFTTLTYYDLVRGELTHFKDCKAEKLWLFSRHGTRYPHHNEVKKYGKFDELRDRIVGNHDKHQRGSLSEDDLQLFRDWNLEVKKKDAGILTKSGAEELREVGRRLLEHYPNLLDHYSPTEMKVNFTSKERTRQSAFAMTEGIFGSPIPTEDSMIDDDLLKVAENCPSWEESQKSSRAKKEADSFKEQSIMQDLLSDVSNTLGFKHHHRLSEETVTAMYKLCGYEQAWHHDKKSPWCAAFSVDQLKVMEYLQELKKYYKGAYGNPLAVKLGCRLVRDMLDSFLEEKRKDTLYFSHDDTMRTLLVALGIGKDKEPLTADNYQQMSERKWHTSYLIPFSANVLSLLYRCPQGSHGISEESRIVLFQNEKLVRLPKCGGKEMCGLEEFKHAYRSLIDPRNCNMDFCHQDGVSL